MTGGAAPIGVYAHWPYCARICPYCDFNVVRERGREAQKAALVEAMLADLAAQAAVAGPRRLVSVFFGGGTPSLMRPDDVAAIVDRAHALWPAGGPVEVTLEANPTDAEADRFAALAQAGVNRLSLGVQSLDDSELVLLGRNHDAAAARRALMLAARLFPRLSADMIYALPGQTTEGWAQSLRRMIDLGPGHISPYQLTIEAGTAFERAVRRRRIVPPDADLAAALYETTQTSLEAAGFEAYEVSNHARTPADRSQHNLLYWRGRDYAGVGPGAHGRLTLNGARCALAAPADIAAYIAAARLGVAAAIEPLSAREAALERLLMGLRTVEGVALTDLTSLNIADATLDRLRDFVRLDHGRLFVASAGRPVLDRVIAELADA